MSGLYPLEVFAMLGIGVSVILVRTAARIDAVGLRSLQLDDCLMLVAALIYGLETTTAYLIGAWWLDMANNGMTEAQRKALGPESSEYEVRVGGSKTQLIEWSSYVLLLWTLKLCVCIFYSRLTAGLYEFELRVKIGYGLIGVTYLATQLSILLGCQPFNHSWQIYPDPGNFCQPAISKLNLYITVILNVSTDVYLLSIPLPMLWKANLVARRKFCLLVVFGGGVLVMMCGVMRCIIVIKNPIDGAQKAGSWACRETFLAVICSNVPIIYPVFRRGVERVTSSSIFSRYRNSASELSYQMKSSLSKPNRQRGHRSVHALPTTLNDAWDSKENIMPVDGGESGVVNSNRVGIAITTEIDVPEASSSSQPEESARGFSYRESNESEYKQAVSKEFR